MIGTSQFNAYEDSIGKKRNVVYCYNSCFLLSTSNQATKTSHLKSVMKEVGVERYLIKVENIE